MRQFESILALDLTLDCGVAVFDRKGHLLVCERLHSPSPKGLRQAAQDVFAAGGTLDWLVSAGAPSAQALWERHAMRRGVRVQRVGLEDWQADLIAGESQAQRQAATYALAHRVITESGLSADAALSLSEARAICTGYWACGRLGLAAAARGATALHRSFAAPAQPAERLRRVA